MVTCLYQILQNRFWDEKFGEHEELVQWLREYTTFVEDPISVPRAFGCSAYKVLYPVLLASSGI